MATRLADPNRHARHQADGFMLVFLALVAIVIAFFVWIVVR